MKRQKEKSKKQRTVSQNTSLPDNDEKEFNEFIRRCLNNKESIEAFIHSSLQEGNSRSEAIKELNRFGIYPVK